MPGAEAECAGECVVRQGIVTLEKTKVSEFILNQREHGREGGGLEDRVLLTIGSWIQSPSDEPVQRLIGFELDGLVDLVDRCAIDAGSEVVERMERLEAQRECAAGRAPGIDAAFPDGTEVFGVESLLESEKEVGLGK